MNEEIEKDMTPIEQTMLRGMTVKLIFTIIAATVAICSTFWGTYYRFQGLLNTTVEHVSSQADDIKDMKNTQRGFQNDLQLQKLQLNTQDVRLNEMEKRLNK